MLQVQIRCHTLCICSRAYVHRVLASQETRLKRTLDIKFTYLISQQAHLSFYSIMHMFATTLMDSTTYECVISPSIVVDAIIWHRVG